LKSTKKKLRILSISDNDSNKINEELEDQSDINFQQFKENMSNKLKEIRFILKKIVNSVNKNSKTL